MLNKLLSHRYGTIYADPPWMERGAGKIKRGADRHYPLMRTEDIEAMGPEVRRVALDASHLYLWVTNNFLPDGLRVMAAWGFAYKTAITWVKAKVGPDGKWRVQIGLGQYFRGATEHCLFGVRGSPGYRLTAEGKRAQGLTVVIAERTKHSVKPWGMRKVIECVSAGPYLELFARETALGWDAWGNEVAGVLYEDGEGEGGA